MPSASQRKSAEPFIRNPLTGQTRPKPGGTVSYRELTEANKIPPVADGSSSSQQRFPLTPSASREASAEESPDEAPDASTTPSTEDAARADVPSPQAASPPVVNWSRFAKLELHEILDHDDFRVQTADGTANGNDCLHELTQRDDLVGWNAMIVLAQRDPQRAKPFADRL